MRLKRCGEILLPSNFYKLHTNPSGHETKESNNVGRNAATSFASSSSTSIFEPYYELPHIDVINEWVIVLESLLNEVYSVQGSESVIMEAMTHQCIVTLMLEQDVDSSGKIIYKMRDLLH